MGRDWGGGAASWDGTGWTNHAGDMPADDVRTMPARVSGGVWFAVTGGSLHYDGATWFFYRARNSGLTHERIAALTEDGDDGVWFGGAAYSDGPLSVPAGLFVRDGAPEPLGEAVPIITAFAPISGTADTLVTITGANFGNRVCFKTKTGDLAVPISSLTNASIAVRVPSQAIKGAAADRQRGGQRRQRRRLLAHPRHHVH